MKAGNACLQRRRCHALVGRRGTCPKLQASDALHLAKSLGGQAHDKPWNAAVAHQKVGTDADRENRIFIRNSLQEGRQIFLVSWLKHDLGRPPRTKPRNFFHSHIWRQTPAQTRKSVPQLLQQSFAINQ